MAINVPGNNQAGDLARVTTHEANDEWPFLLEIVAYYGPNGRRGKRKSIEITSDQFFGRAGHGAPMSAETIYHIIDKLRKDV